MQNTIYISLECFLQTKTILENISSDEKRFLTKWSTNRWIWHFYNVFRNAKSIQIQPIIQKLINQQKIRKQIRIWFEFSRNFLYVLIAPLSYLVGWRITTYVVWWVTLLWATILVHVQDCKIWVMAMIVCAHRAQKECVILALDQ